MTASTADIPGANLDPQDWSRLRLQGHRMLDDIFDHMQGLRDGPLWRAPPDRGLSQGLRTRSSGLNQTVCY